MGYCLVPMTPRSPADKAIQWLLAGDPAIRWQALRDLAGAAEEATVERERRRVSRIGWGARLLAQQIRMASGQAASRLTAGSTRPKWTSTTYTMLMLRDIGLPPASPPARKACKLLLDGGLQPDGGINYGVWAR